MPRARAAVLPPGGSSSTVSGSSRQGRAEEAEPLLAEARETLERLEAKRWPEQVAQFQPQRRTEAVT